MTTCYRLSLFTATLFLLALAPGFSFGQNQVELTPVKDNSLFESTAGDLSNGIGPHLYIGNTNGGQIRRALIAFDIAGTLPADAQIESVTLTMHVSNASPGSGARAASLHKVLADWGEAGSDAGSPGGRGAAAQTGDATWLHRLFDTELWDTPGGDFDDTPSATTNLDAIGDYTWSTTDMTDDVRDWLERPEENFGWIVIGDESGNGTAKRLDSRESSTGPVLAITFSTATATEDEDLPSDFRLAQNYPNPFNPSTNIAYALPATRHVRLRVFDMLGREVTTLVDAVRGPGPHEVVFDAEGLPGGIYLYRLEAGDFSQTRTLTLLK